MPASRTPSKLTTGTLIAACFGVMVGQIGIAIPATLNGLFQTALHPVGSQLTWISDAFLLPVVVLELTFGVLGDLFGRKRLLIGGAGLLVLGEVIAAVASGVHVLWVGQAVAGLGAGALFPTSLAMVAAGTHTERDRARAIAIWAGFLSAGGFVAPILGGLTGAHNNWRLAFWVVAILGIVSMVLTSRLAEDSSAPEGRSLDWGGQITLAIGLVALLFAVIQGPTDGWGSAEVVLAFAFAVVFLVLFVVAEKRAKSPLLRLDLFKNRSFAIASLVAVIGMFAFLGTAYAVSIRLGPLQEQSTMRTAFPFLLLQGPAFLLIPVTSILLRRFNPRWLLASGFALMAIGQFLAASFDVHDTSLASLILPIGLVGIGFALAISSITAASLNTVPLHLAGMASASANLLRDFGFTLGPALVGAVALSRAGTKLGAALPTSGLPAQESGALAGVASEGGPLAVNAVTGPGGPPPLINAQAHNIAMDALGSGYSTGFLVCAIAALVAALLTVFGMTGGAHEEMDPEALLDEGSTGGLRRSPEPA